MAEIRINPEQVESTGAQFQSKRGELESLVSAAQSLMNSLQGQFMGQRATAIFNEWNSMQPSLKNAIITLQSAGDLLKRAANDFRAADSSK
jgi:WXG100 family type VII secretion target